MHKIFVLCAATLLCGNIFVPLANAQTENIVETIDGKPEISFEALRKDLGSIYRGEKITHEFKFKNTGKANLEIRSIHASCGCINTRINPKSILAPNEEGNIGVEFDSSWFAGNIVRTITVDSNVLGHETTILTLTAQIKEEVIANPPLVLLGEIPKDKPNDITINITSPANNIKVLSATSSSTLITPEIMPAKGNTIPIVLKFKNSLPAGALREKITIINTSTHLKELVVPVAGEIVGHVKLSIRYIEFGVSYPNRSVKRSVILSSDLENFKIDSISMEFRKSDAIKKIDTSQIISYNTQKINGGVEIVLNMKVPANTEFATKLVNLSGFLLVKTNDADASEIKIPFFGVLQKENNDE